jgi:hypothetical protein
VGEAVGEDGEEVFYDSTNPIGPSQRDHST